MASRLGDEVLDRGLSVLSDESDAVYLVSADPSTYLEATSTYALGVKTRTAGGFFSAPEPATPNGRKVTLVLIDDGLVTSTGMVTGYAVVTTSENRLDAHVRLAEPFAVFEDDIWPWTILPIDISIPNQ